MAVSLYAPGGKYGTNTSRYPVVVKRPPAPKPVAKQALPGSPQWSQAAQYGWTGSGDPSVVSRATQNQYSSPFSAGRVAGPQSIDYGALIGGDYGVAQSESDMASQMERARGRFRQGINQSLIDLGVTDVSKLGGLGQYIDADTITKAAQNKYSQTAQIAQEETQKRSQAEAALAARGMLSSGQTAKSTEDILASAEGARYSALRSFLGAGETGLTGLADLESSLASQVAQARAAAASRAAETYGWGGPESYDMGFNYPVGQQQQYSPLAARAPVKAPVKKAPAPVRKPPPKQAWGAGRWWGW